MKARLRKLERMMNPRGVEYMLVLPIDMCDHDPGRGVMCAECMPAGYDQGMRYGPPLPPDCEKEE